MFSDIADRGIVTAGYIEFERRPSNGLEEVRKAAKLGEVSRESIESAVKACEVAMMDETSSSDDIHPL
jgi:hypothetical protein